MYIFSRALACTIYTMQAGLNNVLLEREYSRVYVLQCTDNLLMTSRLKCISCLLWASVWYYLCDRIGSLVSIISTSLEHILNTCAYKVRRECELWRKSAYKFRFIHSIGWWLVWWDFVCVYLDILMLELILVFIRYKVKHIFEPKLKEMIIPHILLIS